MALHQNCSHFPALTLRVCPVTPVLLRHSSTHPPSLSHSCSVLTVQFTQIWVTLGSKAIFIFLCLSCCIAQLRKFLLFIYFCVVTIGHMVWEYADDWFQIFWSDKDWGSFPVRGFLWPKRMLLLWWPPFTHTFSNQGNGEFRNHTNQIILWAKASIDSTSPSESQGGGILHL